MVTGNYLPIKNGGIENYTHRLALLLLKNKYEVEIASLNAGEEKEYIFEGIRINNLKGSFNDFELLLNLRNFDICHFHEYSAFGGIELHWIKKSKEFCKKVFFTFHLPYFTCYKKDFRFNGKADCNEFTDAGRCVDCIITEKLDHKNLNSPALLSKIVNNILTITGKKRKLKTKVQLNNLRLTKLLTICDTVFIIADWFKNLLEQNGYEDKKLVLIPNNINPVSLNKKLTSTNIIKKKIIFAGRIEHQKGLHLLCEAMQHLNESKIEIDVYGNKVDEAYYDSCLIKYAFNFKDIVPREALLNLLHEYDFLVLPSIFTEMYPMVIQESFDAQLPVIASAAKGNAAMVKEGVNGFLFEYDNAKDLARTIDKAYHLKLNGWEPEFKKNGNPEKNIEEMLSYYVV